MLGSKTENQAWSLRQIKCHAGVNYLSKATALLTPNKGFEPNFGGLLDYVTHEFPIRLPTLQRGRHGPNHCALCGPNHAVYVYSFVYVRESWDTRHQSSSYFHEPVQLYSLYCKLKLQQFYYNHLWLNTGADFEKIFKW